MRTRTKIVLLGGVVVAGVLGAAWYAQRSRRQGTAVEVGVVAKKDLVSHVLANGKLQPSKKVDVSANIAGQIVNLAVREGDRVKKGDFLLQIDKVQYQASALSSAANLQSLLHDRDAAHSSLEQARYDFEKAKRSYADKLIPETEHQRARSGLEAAESSFQAAEGRVEQARASLAGARDSLSKTTIRAPLGGIVTALPVHEGEVAVVGTMNNPGTVLMTISDLASMEADLAVDETDVPRLRVGQPATLTIEAFPEQTFEGIVREVGSSPIRPGSDAATRTGTTTTDAIDFEVKVSVASPPEAIRPGFSVTAEIETGRAKEVPVVPIQALVTRETPRPGEAAPGQEPRDPSKATATSSKTSPGSASHGSSSPPATVAGSGRPVPQEGVYRNDAGKALFVPIKTGLTGSLEVEVREGLKEGDEIIIGPFRALRELKDGDLIRRSPAEQPGGASPRRAGS